MQLVIKLRYIRRAHQSLEAEVLANKDGGQLHYPRRRGVDVRSNGHLSCLLTLIEVKVDDILDQHLVILSNI